MDKRESLWEAYLAKGMSRRSFLKGCVTLTSLMGLSTDMLTKVVEAAEAKPLPVVIWLHGHECTGCDESFIRSGAPPPARSLPHHRADPRLWTASSGEKGSLGWLLPPGRLFWVCSGSFPGGDMMMVHSRGVSWA